MEKLMKSESDPFIMQKARLDIGSLFFSILFLPVMGGVAVLPFNSRKDIAFWTSRPGPDYWACEAVAAATPQYGAIRGCNQTTGQFVANESLLASNPGLRQQAEACVCSSGILLGWGSHWLNYVALASVVFHSWITGILVTKFSSVFRAVADGIPVLLLYFFLDPLSSRVPAFSDSYTSQLPWPPTDYARNLVCLILPL